MYSAFVRSLSSAGYFPVLCILLCLVSSPLFAQLTEAPVTPNKETKVTSAITAPDGSILFFYPEEKNHNSRFVYKKLKNGIWESGVYNFIPDSFYYQDIYFLQSIVLPSGRIYCLFKSFYYYGIWSDDNGSSWSSPVKLPLEANWVTTGRVFHSPVDNGLYLFAKRGTTRYIKSTNSGESWTAHDSYPLSAPGVIDFYGLPQTAILTITTGPYYSPLALNVNYHDTVSGTYIRTQLNEEKLKAANPVIHSGPDNLMTVYFEQSDLPAGEGITSTTVYYRTSSDNGKTWAPSKKLTSYLGENSNFSVSPSGTVYTLYSTRGEDASPRHYIGNINKLSDEPSPPVIGTLRASGNNGDDGKAIMITVSVADNDLDKVTVTLEKNYGSAESVSMRDDGLFGDQRAGDNIYTLWVPHLSHGDGIAATVKAVDKKGNIRYSEAAAAYISDHQVTAKDSIRIGNFSLMAVNGGESYGGYLRNGLISSTFDNGIRIFSTGFLLSGRIGSSDIVNGYSGVPWVESFTPGTPSNYAGDPRNAVFSITSSDPPFGAAWQNYRFAAETGAEFYDGNGDGIYTPVDVNGNGKWDFYEDAPLLIGDITTYSIAKDTDNLHFALPAAGFTLQTSMFGWQRSDSVLGGMFFVRHKLTYNGNTPAIDSAYYTLTASAAIGGHMDELIGSDPQRNAGYIYNNGNDSRTGSATPALMIAGVQTPQSYEPGVTYEDVNGNNTFDEGVDKPLHFVDAKHGDLLGSISMQGSSASSLSSVSHSMISPILINTPFNAVTLRNLQKTGFVDGKGNPCSWGFGAFAGSVNCQQVTPSFFYSGSPENNTGWLNIREHEQHIYITFGPFRMERGKPVDIISVYAAAEDADAFSAVAKTRRLVDAANQLYQSNFVNAELNTGSNAPVIYPLEFSLSQNYPNPFNPETTIRFNLPQSGMVRLEIFNILGESQKLVINEFMHLGEYTRNINLTGLPSGVYIYRLTTSAASITKKMLYMK